MAGGSQEKEVKNFRDEQQKGADYYAGFSGEGFGGEKEDVPYKLEPNATEIEEFLTRLRQEGL